MVEGDSGWGGVAKGGLKRGEAIQEACACLPLAQIESDSLNSEKAFFFSSNEGNNSSGLPEDVT